MFVFDTDHRSLLQRTGGIEYENLIRRIAQHSSGAFYTSIVSFHEQIRGWTAYLARKRDNQDIVRGYASLEQILLDFSRAQVLPFASAAADVLEDLRRQKVRIGAMDLRIASIVTANQMTLLSRDTVDFEKVPGLTFKDWTTHSD